MAAPSFVNAQTGATDAGGAWTYTCQASAAAGNIFIVQILQDGTTAGSTITITGATNIEDLSGTDNAWTVIAGITTGSQQPVGSPTAAYQHIVIGRALSTSAPTISGGNTTSEDLYIRSYQFTDVSTGTTLTTVIENSTAGNFTNGAATDGTIQDTAVTTLGPDRLALNFVAINDDNAIAAFTGESGGDWTLATAAYAESSGTDGAIGLQMAFPASLSSGPPNSTLEILGGSGTFEELAAQFTTSGSLSPNYITFVSRKTGTPSDNLIIEIQTDAAGLPSGTVVSGSSASIPCSTLTTTRQTYQLSISPALSASTTYHVVFRRDGARDISNYPLIGTNIVGAGGNLEFRASGTWNNDAAGECFFALLTSSDLSGGTINGGTATNADSADGWGVVGFALIGTTVAAAYVPRNPGVHFNDPAIV